MAEHVHDFERSARLEHALDSRDYDGLAVDGALDDVGAAYSCYVSRGSEQIEDPDWWAVQVGVDINDLPRPLRRAFVIALVDGVDAAHVSYVGAGALENFVSDHVDDLDWLESTADEHPRLRDALANVWCVGDVSDETLRRLDRIAGRPLARPRPAREWLPAIVRDRLGMRRRDHS